MQTVRAVAPGGTMKRIRDKVLPNIGALILVQAYSPLHLSNHSDKSVSLVTRDIHVTQVITFFFLIIDELHRPPLRACTAAIIKVQIEIGACTSFFSCPKLCRAFSRCCCYHRRPYIPFFCTLLSCFICYEYLVVWSSDH